MIDPFQRLGVEPYPHQFAAFESMARRENLFVVSPTGSGKSETYLAAALAFQPEVTVIVAPLIALIRDQVRRCIEVGDGENLRTVQ